MKTLKDFVNESIILEKKGEYICSELDPHSKTTKLSSIPGAIKEDTIIFRDINEQEWVVWLEGQKNVKYIKFENCSGTFRFHVRKNKNLESIDFGKCKENMIMFGVNYLSNNPKLKMTSKDFPSNSIKDQSGNQRLDASKSPLVKDPGNGLNFWQR